jgi:hypothetical protein
MKVFLAMNPWLYSAGSVPSFKQLLVIGTWSNSNKDAQIIPPLIVELGSGNRFASILWASAGHDFICDNEIRQQIEEMGCPFEFENVCFRLGRRSPTGPIAREIAQRRYVWPVPRCVGHLDHSRYPDLPESVSQRFRVLLSKDFSKPDKPDHRVFVEHGSAKGAHAFAIAEFGRYAPVFFTEECVERMHRLQPTNVMFSEVGEII